MKTIPSATWLLLGALCWTACGDSAPPEPVVEISTRSAVPLDFAGALDLGAVGGQTLDMGVEARSALIGRGPSIWPPRSSFESDPVEAPAGSELALAIGIKTFGLGMAPNDHPRFEIQAVAGSQVVEVLDFVGDATIERDRWLRLRLKVPEGLEGPVRFRFEISYSPEGLPKGTRLATPAWSHPRLLRPDPEPGPPNLLLIVLDTLRADRTSPYGYDRDTTPFLAELAERGYLLSELISPYPSTLTAHWSLFTGLGPPRHCAYPASDCKGQGETLAEVLSQQGYRTAAFTEGGYVHSYFGFWRGFELYNNGPILPPDMNPNIERFGAEAVDTFERARSWIEQNAKDRFFVFLQTYEVHLPYNPPEEERLAYSPDYTGLWEREVPVEALFEVNNGRRTLTPEQAEHVSNLYDAEIRHLDDAFRTLWGQLEALDVLENTLVVITSDHGEDLMEHGWLDHGTTLFDPALRVPLLVIPPGGRPAGARLDCQRPMVDVMPTVLDLLEISGPDAIDGQSFAEAIAQGSCGESRPAFSEMVTTQYERSVEIPVASVRTPDWKLIVHTQSGDHFLYDLKNDPEERHDRAAEEPERVRELRALLDEYLAAKDPDAAGDVEMSPEVRERLKALGYIE